MISFFNLVLALLLVLGGNQAHASTAILVIGDSHTCGAYGDALVKGLVDQGHVVDRYCMPGSSPAQWLNQTHPPGQQCMSQLSAGATSAKLSRCTNGEAAPPLSQVLARHKYAKVILAFGTNSLGSHAADRNYVNMAKIVSAAASACVWVGPPHLNPREARGYEPARLAAYDSNVNGFYESLKTSKNDAVQNAKRSEARVGDFCQLVDSRAVTSIGRPAGETRDGIHRGQEAATPWAVDTLKQIKVLDGRPALSSDTNVLTKNRR